ncbi:MAG TPA: carbon-nitrogen hydrolase family protein [Thermoleophilia bacterium]|nr:carbon-nitrogen hydrolase family protein [Thermoleophilia bacterium]
MDRSLPLLIAQAVSCSSSDPEAEFASDLQARVTSFSQTQLAIYPELHLNPVTDPAGMEAAAQAIPGPRSDFLCELAMRLKLWLLPGTVYERATDGRIHNTAMVISPDGQIVARYRKCFPWRPWESSVPGDRFVVFDVPGFGCVGLSICYDVWFPEVARHLAWMGAEVILQPSLTPTADRAQELVLARAAAIANQVFIVSVNAAAPSATGQSIVIDPEGHVLLLAGEAPASLTQVIDFSAVERVRRYGTAGLNRPWSQMRDGDGPLPMPLYAGEIDPRRWHPQASPVMTAPLSPIHP